MARKRQGIGKGILSNGKENAGERKTLGKGKKKGKGVPKTKQVKKKCKSIGRYRF